MSFTCIPVQTEANKSPLRKRLLALLLWDIVHLSSPSRSYLGRLILICGGQGGPVGGAPPQEVRLERLQGPGFGGPARLQSDGSEEPLKGFEQMSWVIWQILRESLWLLWWGHVIEAARPFRRPLQLEGRVMSFHLKQLDETETIIMSFLWTRKLRLQRIIFQVTQLLQSKAGSNPESVQGQRVVSGVRPIGFYCIKLLHQKPVFNVWHYNCFKNFMILDYISILCFIDF